MRNVLLIAAMALFAALLAPAVASADPHPEHDQQVLEDGPASEDVGDDRGNPGGSNGTIKIDGTDFFGDFEAHPNNEPHIGCVFEVDLYGFDEGDVATLEFREWHPTESKEPIYVVSTEDPADQLGEDGAGGGIDIDDEQLIDLRDHLVGRAHPVHGHHVRLDAIVTSDDGRDYSKTKVFWTGICSPDSSS